MGVAVGSVAEWGTILSTKIVAVTTGNAAASVNLYSFGSVAAFNGSGNYMVALYTSGAPPVVLYKTGVCFTNGSASVDCAAMTDVFGNGPDIGGDSDVAGQLEIANVPTGASALEAVITTGTRGGPLNSAVQVAFTELERQNRDIKRRYIFSPPVTREELDAINVKEKSTTRSPRPAPKYTVTLKASTPELHAVMLVLFPDIFDDEDISDFTFNIRVGILSPDGAIPERSPSAPYYMTKVPVIPDDLPRQYSRRRRKETFTFTAADAGKTVYFCVCLQNSKGETGPWSQMITAIIT